MKYQQHNPKFKNILKKTQEKSNKIEKILERYYSDSRKQYLKTPNSLKLLRRLQEERLFQIFVLDDESSSLSKK